MKGGEMLDEYEGSFLTVREVAKELRFKEGTVRNMLSKGTFFIKPQKLGTKTLFPKPRVAEYLRETGAMECQ